jgi:hypothetical protein
MIDIIMSLVKTGIFFIGIFFSIVLMGKRGKAVREAVRGNVIIIDTPNHK